MPRAENLSYFHWSYLHHNENAAGTLHFKVIDVHPFEGSYSTNVRVYLKGRIKWQKMILPLWNYGSNNPDLLEEWNSNLEKGKIKKGKEFSLKTWLGTSKNEKTIRRFHLKF